MHQNCGEIPKLPADGLIEYAVVSMNALSFVCNIFPIVTNI